MNVQDLKNILHDYPDCVVEHKHDAYGEGRDSTIGEVWIRVIYKGELIIEESCLYYIEIKRNMYLHISEIEYRSEQFVINLAKAKGLRSLSEAINKCCLVIMHYLIASGINDLYKHKKGQKAEFARLKHG
jgi:hypothetical protein